MIRRISCLASRGAHLHAPIYQFLPGRERIGAPIPDAADLCSTSLGTPTVHVRKGAAPGSGFCNVETGVLDVASRRGNLSRVYTYRVSLEKSRTRTRIHFFLGRVFNLRRSSFSNHVRRIGAALFRFGFVLWIFGSPIFLVRDVLRLNLRTKFSSRERSEAQDREIFAGHPVSGNVRASLLAALVISGCRWKSYIPRAPGAPAFRNLRTALRGNLNKNWLGNDRRDWHIIERKSRTETTREMLAIIFPPTSSTFKTLPKIIVKDCRCYRDAVVIIIIVVKCRHLDVREIRPKVKDLFDKIRIDWRWLFRSPLRSRGPDAHPRDTRTARGEKILRGADWKEKIRSPPVTATCIPRASVELGRIARLTPWRNFVPRFTVARALKRQRGIPRGSAEGFARYCGHVRCKRCPAVGEIARGPR